MSSEMCRAIARLLAAALLVAAPAAGQPSTPDAPLTLQSVLDLARANSQQVRASQLVADLASEDRKQARATPRASSSSASVISAKVTPVSPVAGFTVR